MRNPTLRAPEFLDAQAIDAELTRVFEHCHDCRRCLPLCPAFPALFKAIDRHGQEASQLTQIETREVVDLCYQCKLCYNNCPYHAPHEWEIDFPRLMSRAKLSRAAEEGIPLAERLSMHPDTLGRIGCAGAPLANAALGNRAGRVLMEKAVGIDRRWPLPRYANKRASRQAYAGVPRNPTGERAVLYPTCFVEYNEPETAHAVRQVVEHNGIGVEVIYPGCCGAPALHGGDLAGARRRAEQVTAGLIESVRAGLPILVPGPTCSYQLRREIPELLGSDDARQLAERIVDVGEFLFSLGRAKRLDREFPKPLGRVAYHVPCHLKAQNVGFRFPRLLELAGAEVETLEHCSGVDGTWGMKARWYEQSLAVAAKLVAGIERADAAHVATDCPLAALRIQERTGRPAVHPVRLLRDAYGLGGEAS